MKMHKMNITESIPPLSSHSLFIFLALSHNHNKMSIFIIVINFPTDFMTQIRKNFEISIHSIEVVSSHLKMSQLDS